MKHLVIAVFLTGLIVCLCSGFSVLWALLLGVFCFSGYALSLGYHFTEITLMLWSGIYQVRNILFIFGLIGMLTAVWRASGTIPFLIHSSMAFVDPSYFFLWAFLLCSMLSILLGTAIGTASTLGLILMLLARATGMNEMLTAGAVMSGIYVGDRCSPMSSSAALVCALTQTVIYNNIKPMVRTSAIPFLLTAAVYLALSLMTSRDASAFLSEENLQSFFILSGWTLLPAVCVIILALLRVDVKITMAVSIVAGCAICLFIQRMTAPDLAFCLIAGYVPQPGAEMMAGGGIRSMLTVGGIVLLSSSYAGIFSRTGLLADFENGIKTLAGKIGTFRTMILVSIPLSGLSCNQTLAAILTTQMCSPCYKRRQDMAIHLANSVIVIAALIPWSIASTAPCAAMGTGMGGLLFAFYLYMVPAWNAVYGGHGELHKKRNPSFA